MWICLSVYPWIVFIVDVFVGGECVGIGIVGIELDGPVKEEETVFVLFLETEAVADCNPRLLGEDALLQTVVGQVGQLHRLLQVPQANRVVLHSFQSVRLHFQTLPEILLRLTILAHLHVCSSYLTVSPPCSKLLLWQYLQRLDCFIT